MNSIEDISSLAELVNLTDVSLHNNAITDVSALEEHVNLKNSICPAIRLMILRSRCFVH